MRSRIAGALLAVVLATLVATPASAANKEHQQLMADIRMLQEQAQLLQNMLGTLNESIKAVNTRLDEQNTAMRKAFADQKLLIDNLTSDLRVVREKVDDNNVRIGSLREELEAVRQTVQQVASRPPTTPEGGGAGTTEPGSTPPVAPPLAPGTSPTQLWDMAWGDYTLGQYDLAIQGFESYLRYFPKSDRAADAQVKIGQSYYMAGNKTKALEAFDKAIRDYPNNRALAEAYVRKGVVLVDLKQGERAREAFEYVIKTYPPDSAEAIQAKQQLDRMKKP
jgi:tol-pal system protein YbgF